MSTSFLNLIKDECVVLDGAFGTMLEKRGYTPEQLPEEWNIHSPETVRDIHLEYYRAGAQIVTTNTFGASPIKMGMRGKEDLVDQANRRGVQLVREALRAFRKSQDVEQSEREEQLFIAGSVGPCGKVLGMDLTREQAEHSVMRQVTNLAEEGVDLYIVETMMDLREAELVVKTIRSEMEIPVIASMVFNRTKDGSFRTLFGDTPGDCVQRLMDSGADAVGTNCGLIEVYVEVIARMRELTREPLVLYPNAGIPKLTGTVTTYDVTSEELLRWLDASLEAGASILGGCCGTTPEYISELSRRIKHTKRIQ
jgi:5-methyltetrahydrofolate--homocysteine methyltransferase